MQGWWSLCWRWLFAAWLCFCAHLRCCSGLLELLGLFLNTVLALCAQGASGLVSLREGGGCWGNMEPWPQQLGATLVLRESGLCSQMAKSRLLYVPGSAVLCHLLWLLFCCQLDEDLCLSSATSLPTVFSTAFTSYAGREQGVALEGLS